MSSLSNVNASKVSVNGSNTNASSQKTKPAGSIVETAATGIFQTATAQPSTSDQATQKVHSATFADRFIPSEFPSMDFNPGSFAPFNLNQFVPISQATFVGTKCPTGACPIPLKEKH